MTSATQRDELDRLMNRRTTPRSYYQHFVEPNFQDYLQSPDDVGLGFNASLTAFQLAEVMYWFYKRNDPAVVSSWNALRRFSFSSFRPRASLSNNPERRDCLQTPPLVQAQSL